MAGIIQLEATGSQDRYFTDNPEFTYFVKNFKKHENYSKFYTDLDFDGNVEFGEEVRCTIPQNQCDLLKGVSVKITLNPLEQTTSREHVYCESIAQAMIEYADLNIGGKLIQRVPSDMLAVHSELYVTQSKQRSLKKLIGKPFEIFSVYNDYSNVIRESTRTQSTATTPTSYRVDIPFYFHEHPELAIPIYAITKQEVEIVIKFRKAETCIYEISVPSLDVAESYYLGINPTGLIREAKLAIELIALDKKEKLPTTDYVITQFQQNVFNVKASEFVRDEESRCNVCKVMTNFKYPVKELFFIVQDKLGNDPNIVNDFVTPFQYSSNVLYDDELDKTFTNAEQVKYITIDLDNEATLNKVTGDFIHLRAIQPGKHHSRTPIYRRFYMYNFGLEPERWYPTGQVNFSLINNQRITFGLFNYPSNADKQLRVYAHSYNILRVENGTAHLLFDTQ